MIKPKVIAVVGPTASGKSSLGTYLAHKVGGEIVSADSRQVYKGMRVISRSEPGHLVGIADPKRAYSVGEYQRDAAKACAQIFKKGKVPVVVGGAGLYADAFLRGWQLPKVAPDKKLRARLAKESPARLFALLKKRDPAAASRVDRHNPARLVRALEIAAALGSVPTLTLDPPYEVLWLGLKKSKNIRAGVEARLRSGMAAEAKKLRASLPKKRYAELGFEFSLLADYEDKIGPRPTRLGREKARTELVEKLVKGEEEYAKRQNRWFKRHKDIHWVGGPGRTGKAEALRLAKKFLGGR